MLFGSKLQRSTFLFTAHDKYLMLTLRVYICHKHDFIVISDRVPTSESSNDTSLFLKNNTSVSALQRA